MSRSLPARSWPDLRCPVCAAMYGRPVAAVGTPRGSTTLYYCCNGHLFDHPLVGKVTEADIRWQPSQAGTR